MDLSDLYLTVFFACLFLCRHAKDEFARNISRRFCTAPLLRFFARIAMVYKT